MWGTVLALCLAGTALGQSDAAAADELSRQVQLFETADAELNAVYQLARELLPEQVFIALRDTQREWLEGRDTRAADIGTFNRAITEDDRPAAESPEFWEARRWLTEDRTDFVRGWIRAYDGSLDSLGRWEGVWTDGYGGGFRLLDTGDGHLLLDILVVRGPTAHTGAVSGRGDVLENEAVFSWEVPGQDDAAELRMRRLGPLIVIETSGPIDYFHGVRAYFDGSYVRVDALSPLQRLELLDGHAPN